MARVKAPPAAFRNRILRSGEEAPEQLLANPLNWRLHPGRQRDALRGSLSSVGWVQQVIVNERTGHLVDGHARVEEAISKGEASVPVLYVDLSPEEERIILATLDPIGAMAGQSDERLRELLADVTVDDAALAAMLAKMAGHYGDAYTTTISVPRYEPSGERPAVAALRDETKAEELRAGVLAEPDLEPAVRDYLLAAASRHTVFDYQAAAEFYAGSPAGVQRLMEASALVLIDYEDAIRGGYVRFLEAIEAMADQDVAREEEDSAAS